MANLRLSTIPFYTDGLDPYSLEAFKNSKRIN